MTASLTIFIVGLAVSFWYLFKTYAPVPVDPAWAVAGDLSIPKGAVTVRFTGTSTLLFSDGETAWMVDGWFTRVGPLSLVSGTIEPDVAAIARGLERNGLVGSDARLAAVIPVHSHFDHAMDAPEVARRTGALLIGSESTANIGRGWGLPESQIRVAGDREAFQLGAFKVTLVETRHFEFADPEMREKALANPRIEAPLVPPVGAFDYRVGQPYAIHVEHPRGSFLIQASAGFEEGAFAGLSADLVFLGIGGLGTQSAEYREAYWRETVTRIHPERLFLIHWDDLTAPIEGPFRGTVRVASALSGGTDETRAYLETKAASLPEMRFLTLPRYDEVVLFSR
ncbi:MAG: MBL fold metallo-hydrolase [Myxococcota bacterium]